MFMFVCVLCMVHVCVSKLVCVCVCVPSYQDLDLGSHYYLLGSFAKPTGMHSSIPVISPENRFDPHDLQKKVTLGLMTKILSCL